MTKVVIELTLKQYIWTDKEDWIEEFGEELPTDIEDVEMLEDISSRKSTELVHARFLGDWIEKD